MSNSHIIKKPTNHKRYRSSVVMRAILENGIDKEKAEKLINNTGIAAAFVIRKDVINIELALKKTVTETLNEIRLSKAKMKELFVYPSDVEKGTKTIREYCNYVEERTTLAQLRSILYTIETVRTELNNSIKKSNILWWTRPKEKTTTNQ